jgi:ankyrin repeat protein
MALKIAVNRGNLKQVQSVLLNEPDVNHEYDDGFFILHLAVKALDSGMVKELILAGADISKKTRKEGNTPLHIACTLDYKLVAEELLRYKPKLDDRNRAGNTPLEEAILAQSSGCCTLLYDAGANINELNPTSGRTPFMLACEIRAFNIAELLLILGANRHLNTDSKYPDIQQLLLDQQASKNTTVANPKPAPRPLPSNPRYRYDSELT